MLIIWWENWMVIVTTPKAGFYNRPSASLATGISRCILQRFSTVVIYGGKFHLCRPIFLPVSFLLATGMNRCLFCVTCWRYTLVFSAIIFTHHEFHINLIWFRPKIFPPSPLQIDFFHLHLFSAILFCFISDRFLRSSIATSSHPIAFCFINPTTIGLHFLGQHWLLTGNSWCVIMFSVSWCKFIFSSTIGLHFLFNHRTPLQWCKLLQG